MLVDGLSLEFEGQQVSLSLQDSYYYLLIESFFTSVLAGDFSLAFEWQQVSSSLQDSFQFRGRSQLCCS